MPLANDPKIVGDEYDIIIVGGGSSGCVLAGRLSETARQEGRRLSILLIESGRDNHNDPNVVRPGRYWANLNPNSGYFNSIKGNLDHCGREIEVAVPNILGGGGSVNFMMYTRASASDFDDWRTEGWYAEDLVPILRKIENYQFTRDPKPDQSVHGFSGPFAVSHGPDFREQSDPNAGEVYHAAQKLGYPIAADMQNLRNGAGFSEWPKWIDPVTGHRQDPAHRYIHPNISEHSNNGLTVLCEHRVVRVIISGGRATGVEIVHSHTTSVTDPIKLDLPLGRPQSGGSKTTTNANAPSHPVVRSIRARSMVVLTAGTANTPQLLERSGIGSSEILRKANVECLVDLPGVGENLQDHLAGSQYFYRFDKDTLPHYNDYLRDDPAAMLEADEDFKQGGKGPHSMNFIGGAGRIRPTEEELQEMGPAFRKLWNTYYLNAPDKSLFISCFLERPINDPQWTFLTPEYSYKIFIPYILYPVSRGSIHITSSSINALPNFRPQYLFDPRDLPPHVLAYKHQREFARRMPSFRGEVREFHPPFPEASAARCVEYPTAEQRVEIANSKVVYTEEDNNVIEEWVKANLFPVWHWLGTAAMRPREQGGVVDGNLNVYGVQGLKVADLSICPENVGANTYSTALLLGGKAAEIVAKELGLGMSDN